MKFTTLIAAVLAVSLAGCSTISLNCLSDHVTTATLNGPNIVTIAQQLVTILGPMVASGGLATKQGLKATAPATTNDGTLTVKTLDIVGVQQYSCGNAAAAPTPAPGG